MPSIIRPEDIYDKNLNFLLGSGASYGIFPTLALKMKETADGEAHSIETLATHFAEDEVMKTLVFMHYYQSCIKPVIDFDFAAAANDPQRQPVIANYRGFLETILQLLSRRRPLDKRCNVFTTNYDGCIVHVADEMLRSSNLDFIINDGGRGFHRRYLHAKNFNSYLCQTGVFERQTSGVPQINVVHLHGSVYWRKEVSSIRIDYQAGNGDGLLNQVDQENLAPFSECLNDPAKITADLPEVALTVDRIQQFWSNYNTLPIVNPTKWKFHETVFEEHYYQMLRLLSYELEKPNSVLVTFGFSFADEHIRNLIQRSLANSSLQVFVCCFDALERDKMNGYFGIFPNVQCIVSDDGNFLDFTTFNRTVLTLQPEREVQLENAIGAVE
ncbi:UNVERIFIED_ORG: hypothetical protein DFO49_4059 [Herbaspirillum seropedicae]